MQGCGTGGQTACRVGEGGSGSMHGWGRGRSDRMWGWAALEGVRQYFFYFFSINYTHRTSNDLPYKSNTTWHIFN